MHASDVLIFRGSRPVTQPVTSCSFPMGATMENDQLQREFPLLARMEGPAVVPPALLHRAKTYREAVRYAWALRRVRNMTFRQLAAEAGLIYQHVGDYFNADDKPGRRDLPGGALEAVESVLGNSYVSQWHAMRARLTILEEMQAMRNAA